VSTIVFDIEADALLYDASIIWCLVGYDKETFYIYHVDIGEPVCYPKNTVICSIEEMLDMLATNHIVGHNIIAYDLPLLHKLHNYSYKIENMDDTIIMSRLFYPDREGHSLEWWGEKLRFKKGEHTDFSHFSQEMLDYCIQDVLLTTRVYEILQTEGSDWDWTPSLTLEYNIQHIQTIQETNGVLFDTNKATKLLEVIGKEIKEIEEKVVPAIPYSVVNDGPVNKPFKKDGSYSEQAKRWLNED
jgi:DNA polymerase I-like protein with 3'-5' exonuclease and polymerase domains